MFDLKHLSNIKDFRITEHENYMDVELYLADAQSADSVQEYLSFSVCIDYQQNNPGVEDLKRIALERARKTISHEIAYVDKLKGKS